MDVSARLDHHSGIPLLWLSDELDLGAQAELEGLVTKIQDSGERLLLVDLREVSYLDSLFLGILIGLDRHLSDRGGALAVVHTSPDIARLFDIAGLTGRLNVFDGLGEAGAYLLTTQQLS